MIAATAFVALSSQAQVMNPLSKKSAQTPQSATINQMQKNSAHKLQTTIGLQNSNQEIKKTGIKKPKAEKGDIITHKNARALPQNPRRFASKKVELSESIPVSVPYVADFSTTGDAMEEDFIVINNNDDLSDNEPCTWNWSYGNGAYYVYNVDEETAADDYLVLPVNLVGGTTYEVVVNAASWNYPEEFEVVEIIKCCIHCYDQNTI